MQHSFYYRKYKFLDESLSKDQESNLIEQFLQNFKNNINPNTLESKLLNVLNVLYNKGQFHIQYIDRDDKAYNQISNAFGYFSAFENCIYLIVDKDNFEKKWLGLFTDYNNLNKESIEGFISTCMHELMHFVCTNYYNTFKKIWGNVIRKHIYFIFTYLIQNYFYDFVDKETFAKTSPKSFLENPKFKSTIDVYYNSISINTRFRYKSHIKKYNDILSNLYSKGDFGYARFIDNVLINTMKLRDNSYGKTSMELYYAIKQAYIDLEPNLANININILFYQEMLDFSEIPCVLATYYKYIKNYTSYIERTLDVI